MQNHCSEIALGKPEECILDCDRLKELIEDMINGCPSLIIICLNKDEKFEIRNKVMKLLPISILKECVSSPGVIFWEGQQIYFYDIGDTIDQSLINKSSIYWTINACEATGYEPHSDEATMGDHNCPVQVKSVLL